MRSVKRKQEEKKRKQKPKKKQKRKRKEKPKVETVRVAIGTYRYNKSDFALKISEGQWHQLVRIIDYLYHKSKASAEHTNAVMKYPCHLYWNDAAAPETLTRTRYVNANDMKNKLVTVYRWWGHEVHRMKSEFRERMSHKDANAMAADATLLTCDPDIFYNFCSACRSAFLGRKGRRCIHPGLSGSIKKELRGEENRERREIWVKTWESLRSEKFHDPNKVLVPSVRFEKVARLSGTYIYQRIKSVGDICCLHNTLSEDWIRSLIRGVMKVNGVNLVELLSSEDNDEEFDAEKASNQVLRSMIQYRSKQIIRASPRSFDTTFRAALAAREVNKIKGE